MKVKSGLESLPREKLYQELGMTKAGAEQDVQTIKAWLLKQPHLPTIRSEWLSVQVDDWLETYLILCKNSIERTKEALDLYFTTKVLFPEVFGNRDPLAPAFQQSYRTFHLGLGPNVSASGDRLLVFSHTRPTADDFDPIYMMMRGMMMMDIILLEGVHHYGLEIVVDFRNVCFAQLARYNLALTKKILETSMKAYPHRVRRIHLVNPSTLVEYTLSSLKMVLSKKLQDRIVVHKDPADLVKAVGSRIVPADFGGDAPTIAQISSFWDEKLLEYRDWFLQTESIKSDESKRAGKCRTETSSDFGYQGSFRKIEVD